MFEIVNLRHLFYNIYTIVASFATRIVELVDGPLEGCILLCRLQMSEHSFLLIKTLIRQILSKTSSNFTHLLLPNN
jgi:hypothetical protein